MPERLRPYILNSGSFDEADLRAMGDAFDQAKAKLDGRSHKFELHEVATRIIALAQLGERDPAKLCARAIAALKDES